MAFGSGYESISAIVYSNSTQYSELVEVLPPLLHLLRLRALVVVLVDDVSRHVRAVADRRLGDVTVEVVRDSAPAERVRADARGAFRCIVRRCGLAVTWVAVVGAFCPYAHGRVIR